MVEEVGEVGQEFEVEQGGRKGAGE